MFRRDLAYYRAQFLALLAVFMLAGSIIGGSLLVGHSLRQTLLHKVALSLGKIESVLSSPYFFAASLADRLDGHAAGVIALDGLVGYHDLRLPVKVYGIDDRFFALSPSASGLTAPSGNQSYVNQTLLAKLGLTKLPEDLQLLPGVKGNSRDFKFAADVDLRLRLEPVRILSAEEFGLFCLINSQQPEPALFVSRSMLAAKLKLPGKVNVIVSDAPPAKVETLAVNWQDLDLEQSGNMIKSRQYFIPYQWSKHLASDARNGFFSYFVDSLTAKNGRIDYAFVLGSNLFDLKGNEMILNSECAAELSAKAGDTVVMSYFAPEETASKLNRAKFVVKMVVPTDKIAPLQRLMADIPDLTDVGSCSDWQGKYDIDMGRVAEADKRYFKQYRTTPRALITLAMAQHLWKNRFGEFTAIKDPGREVKLSLADAGIQLAAPQAQFAADAKHGVDLGGLFLALNFFVILGVLILSYAMLRLYFALRQKDAQIMAACGLAPQQIRRILLVETMVVVLAGTVLGGLAGGPATAWVLQSLTNLCWAKMLAGGQIEWFYSFRLTAVATGAAAALNLGLLLLAARSGQLRQSRIRRLGKFLPVIGATLWLWALIVLLLPLSPVSKFVLCGVLWLLGGLVFVLTSLGDQPVDSILALAWRGNVANRHGTLAVIAFLAVGSFLVVAVGLNYIGVTDLSRTGGTGGYQEYFALAKPTGKVPGVSPGEVLYLRRHDGSPADCLNLNRVSNPVILGVDTARLAVEKRFSFAGDFAWQNFADRPERPIYAVADSDVITWSLQKKVGDTLEIVGENGETYPVELAGALDKSIFQGAIVMDEADFLRLFPSSGGYQLILADPAAVEKLGNALRNFGVAAESTAARLNRFNDLQNTYLNIFMELGLLGLLLTSLGTLAAFVRHLYAVRSETRTLTACGFTLTHVKHLRLWQFMLPVTLGIIIGAVSGLLAVLPVLAAGQSFGVLLARFVIAVGLLLGLIALAATAAIRWFCRDTAAVSPGDE